jgi:predicted kinase
VTRQALPKTALVLLAGVAGSGKSTVARGLLQHLHAVYLDNNFIADAFFPDTRHGLEYRRLRPRMYRALYRIAGENLSLGNSVLLDAPHIRQSRSTYWYQSMRSLARGAGAELVMIRCVASEQEIRRRLEARGKPRDQWKLQNWETHVRSQPVSGTLPHPHLDLLTERSVEETVHEAFHYILARAARSGSQGQ